MLKRLIVIFFISIVGFNLVSSEKELTEPGQFSAVTENSRSQILKSSVKTEIAAMKSAKAGGGVLEPLAKYGDPQTAKEKATRELGRKMGSSIVYGFFGYFLILIVKSVVKNKQKKDKTSNG